MKRIALFIVLASVMILATACGSSAPTATQAPTQPAATNPPAAQASPTTESASSAATEVDVTLADNTIQSSLTTFKVGVPYTFVVKNTGHHAHNFNISTPVSVAGSLDAALSGALLSIDQNKLAVGGTATVQYTFPASAAGQPMEFSCLIKRHYEDGMKLAVTITQ